MTGDRQRLGLDPRAWLAWSFAASLPSLLGRNPWPLLMVLVAVVSVRLAWADRIESGTSWTLFMRIAVIFSLIGVVFNVLTVSAGDRVIATLPQEIPLIGGAITLNAALFGLLSGLALVILVIIGSTVAGLLDWTAVVRLLPSSMTNVAVAGSIAFAFVPQTAAAYREIREAQSARGHRVRGGRDLLPILVPMMGSGLERAITLAEALESRAFGAPSNIAIQANRWPRYVSALGLASATMATYLMASGYSLAAGGTATFGAICFLIAMKVSRISVIQRSRYRTAVWTIRDTAVTTGAAVAVISIVFALHTNPDSLRYEPYPHLPMPVVSLSLLIGLLALLTPLFVAPPPETRT